MIPREHGGWAMLLIPYTIGLGVTAGFGLHSALFLLSIVLVFMASEPLGVLARARRMGNRQKRSAALRWLGLYLFGAGLASAPLALLYGRWWLILFGVLGAALLGAQALVESRRLDRTVAGELLGALGLSLSAPGAYYVAAGELGFTALVLWLLTALHSAGSVFYINMRLRHRLAKEHRADLHGRLVLGRDTIAYLFMLLVVLVGLSYLRLMPLLALLAFLPLICKTVKGLYEARPEFTFKRLGLVELANSIVFAVLLILSWLTI